jgi:Fe-S-cluster containining protein
MILHEFCHSIVQGSDSFGWVDWGLDNESSADGSPGKHDFLEHAALRLQAALLQDYGLRQCLAPTTSFREFYDKLDLDPFLERRRQERKSITIACAALTRSQRKPWAPHLQQALKATREFITSINYLLEKEEVKVKLSAEHKALFSKVTKPPEQHPIGQPLHSDAALDYRCGDCAWFRGSNESQSHLHCLRSPQTPLKSELGACQGFEAKFDCLGCGACCREAYDTVEVDESDPAYELHLPLLQPGWGGGYDMKRDNHRCSCLQGGEDIAAREPAICSESSVSDRPPEPLTIPNQVPFTCAIYETRPSTCREFTLGSDYCLDARRRVGLSR